MGPTPPQRGIMLPFIQSVHRKLVSHIEDPMDWDDEFYQDRIENPSFDTISITDQEIIVPSLEPVDIEFLLNFISGWKENGISDLFYFTESEQDNAFELVTDLRFAPHHPPLVSEVTFFAREEGSRIACRSWCSNDSSIDALIEDTITTLLNL